MKKITIGLCAITFFSQFTVFQKDVLLREFNIGKFRYCLYKHHIYLHDDNTDADYFVINKQGHGKEQNSALMLQWRKDSIFTRGSYSVKKDHLEFTEHWYHNFSSPIDSIITIFYPDRQGRLVLKGSIKYIKGKTLRTDY